jgi:hypothetical protein
MGPHSGDEVKGVWTNWSSGRRQLVLVGRRRRKGYGMARDKKRDATGEQRRDSHGIDRIKKRTTGEWTSA